MSSLTRVDFGPSQINGTLSTVCSLGRFHLSLSLAAADDKQTRKTNEQTVDWAVDEPLIFQRGQCVPCGHSSGWTMILRLCVVVCWRANASFLPVAACAAVDARLSRHLGQRFRWHDFAVAVHAHECAARLGLWLEQLLGLVSGHDLSNVHTGRTAVSQQRNEEKDAQYICDATFIFRFKLWWRERSLRCRHRVSGRLFETWQFALVRREFRETFVCTHFFFVIFLHFFLD